MENKLPECPYYVAHPQAVWFNEHWRPVIERLKVENSDLKYKKEYLISGYETILNDATTEFEQLKADARTSELNRQSLWADSVKMADELNYLKAKTDIEIQQLKSKLEIAKKALNTALNYLHWREDDLIGDDCIGDGKLTAQYKNKVSEIEKAILEIGEV